MRERAALIGAKLSITSTPGNGCTIILSMHLANEQRLQVDGDRGSKAFQ
jgi:nitrate/nitrite-specific signal transduction histidine kinase